MDFAEMIERAAAHAEDVVKGIGPSQLDLPTPCKDWDVRALGNHLTGFLAFSAGAARRSEPEGGRDAPDFAGSDNWSEMFSEMASDLAAAWKADGALEGQTQFGEDMMDATAAASVTIEELVIHAWDLASATGQQYQADDDLTHVALQVVTGGQATENDRYGPPQPIDEDAPIFHKTLAMSGRAPDWKHLGPLTQGHD
ncbi:MAG: TIGR03086 family protein [Acidimicrobiia bacterium]|nr:TIGR03086 family protein [Acidimicrobiia bacterium]MBT8249928.1 TIGR03086 family protein [Acidimicrobiia bacterium]NNL28097.1 TIGR03086 family protein [Acidimicrobiia bacterium]